MHILGYHPGGMVRLRTSDLALETTARRLALGDASSRHDLVCKRSARVAWVAYVLAMTIGCGSGLAGRTYRHGDIVFDVGPIPASWHQLDADDAAFAFRDDAAGVTVAVNARCHERTDDVPLKALTKHLFLDFTDRSLIAERSLELDGREALRTELFADLDGVPMHFTVYVLKKDWCVYDFMHIATLDSPATSRAQFDQFVSGFATRG